MKCRLVVQVVSLFLAVTFYALISGCSSLNEAMADKKAFRNQFRISYTVVPALEQFIVPVSAEGTFEFFPDAREYMKGAKWSSTDVLFDREISAISEFFVDDLKDSGMFASVNEKGKGELYLSLRIGGSRCMTGNDFREKVYIEALDPVTGDRLVRFERQGVVPNAIFTYLENRNRFLMKSLGDLRRDLAVYIHRRGYGGYVSPSTHPTALPTALPLPTEPAAPF